MRGISQRITVQIMSSFTRPCTVCSAYIYNAAFAASLSSERVHIVTWNVGSAVPPDDISSLFGPNVSDGSVDMFVIG